ncbi:MAG: MobV family relaxase [Clostridium sp.]|uniref:MobV family relaxase n=1 Tax=Clostridium sp. TaxID=1506 RepID=UPI002909247D|nr:MobV family relaxase [Clostridium sp.]MDU5211572.1 MobV family relaxase [Clostridium sp.]
MSYMVCHFGKYKAGNVFGLQKHNQRENKNYSNIDIDKARIPLNYDLVNKNDINYLKKIKTIIEANRRSERAIRKDVTVYCECIVSSDGTFFENLTEDKQKEFFKSSLEYLKNKIGEEFIISANVHLDETTPHMHVGFVPIIENSLSAKKLIDRKFLREVQDQLPAYLKNLGFDIQRGIEGSKRKHKDVKEFKKELEREVENKCKDINTIENYKNELEGKIEQLEADLNKRTIEYNNATKVLNKNSLRMYQIQEMKVEPIMFSSDKVKIDKNDFERLKDSALKAYTQHNLYATVLHQLEKLKEEKQYYKSELEESRRCRAKDYNDFRYELNSLKKENERLGSEIDKVNEILRGMSKESRIEFFKLQKEIEKENVKFKKEKNKSHEMSL